MVTTKSDNNKFIKGYLTKKSVDKGLDVISPTWFYLDGININFEGLGVANKQGFNQFVRDLSKKLHEKNMVVSVNVTAIEDASIYNFYDRKELSKYVDYIVLIRWFISLEDI